MVRLSVLEGRESGEVFVSREAYVSLGTAPDNEAQLTDPFVSRHHGLIILAAGKWVYRDLGSSNGSTIERAGGRVALDRDNPEFEIEPGDLLFLGQTVLRFEVTPPTPIGMQHTVVASRSLADLDVTKQRHIASFDGLAAAYQLERQISLSFDPEKTLDAILDALLAAFPAATHAIILLIDKRTGRPKRQVAKVRGEEGRAREEIPVSMSVAGRVLEEGKSLLFHDVLGEFGDSRSVAAAGITSSLCAPLWTGDETVGLIQVDTRGGRGSFSESDLDRLCFFASRAALAIVGSELCDAEQRNRMLQDLSAMITHDLKGPLTGVMGFLDLLSREQLANHQKDYVEIALASSKWLAVLIAAILDVAKMEAGEIKLEREPLEIGEELRQALDLISYQLREKEIQLDAAVSPELPPVSADRELFRRIIVNLVGNAVKFAPVGCRVAVEAKLDKTGNAAVVTVRDEGPGISPEHQARIFDKFVQVAKGQSAEQVSVGLGLAFCKLAVQAHGGRIWVESQPGRGASFSFSLPLSPPPLLSGGLSPPPLFPGGLSPQHQPEG